ncbi:MAG: sigma-54-dependent Fis family transcriptional regulator [Burkholderiales bacterium]|nr:MAG: sigma-54-dependent Fis family transcriptional regulator [Burkholderiales bacterium]
MPSLNVLVVDDEPAIRQVLSAAIRKAGYEVDSARSGVEAASKLAKGDFDVVLTDISMPVMDGMELLRHAREQGLDIPFIMITGYASVESAIEAIKAGAYDYITKPVRHEEILHRLSQIEALRGLRDENRALRALAMAGTEQQFRFGSPPMLEVERLVQRVAPTDSTVLIVGESGTGKGIVARQIHELSDRSGGPLIPVNCGAIPENLLESEFFGHTKGAFTSADRARKGLFAQADGGTIFLDEIGELPLGLQAKLLHVIEEKVVRPLGSEQQRRVDVRIIAATNRDLGQRARDGEFREDLYFRLSVFQIALPPLRERREDIPALVRFLLGRHCAASGSAEELAVDPDAEEILINYDWPGNVRQLENVLQRAAILADGGRITAADLPAETSRPMTQDKPAGFQPLSSASLREQVRRFEVALIRRAIEDAGGDRRLAAQRLGIGLSSLYRKLEEYQHDDSSASMRSGNGG